MVGGVIQVVEFAKQGQAPVQQQFILSGVALQYRPARQLEIVLQDFGDVDHVGLNLARPGRLLADADERVEEGVEATEPVLRQRRYRFDGRLIHHLIDAHREARLQRAHLPAKLRQDQGHAHQIGAFAGFQLGDFLADHDAHR